MRVALFFTCLLAAACGVSEPRGSDATATATGSGGSSSQSASASQSQSSVATGSGGQGLTPNLPPKFVVHGKVVDQDGKPLADAIVLQGGRSHEPTIKSASDGTFTLSMIYSGQGYPTAVASKSGYRTAGFEIENTHDPIVLELRFVKPPDNLVYEYGDPGQGDDPSAKHCGHCHNTITKQFQTSKHAQATKNPLVQDLYAGVTGAFTTKTACEAAGGVWRAGLKPGTGSDVAMKCYLGGGVLPDLNPSCGGSNGLACDDPALTAANKPKDFGACADCHSPGMSAKAGGRNLHDAVGVAYDNGVHCDFCHHVADVDLGKPPGAGQRLVVMRPSESIDGDPTGAWRQAMFGPLLDVPNPIMGGVYTPKFSTADFCAGCHQQLQKALLPGDSLAARFASGLPVHSTYEEWLASPYATAKVPCHQCHMPAYFELQSSADLATDMTSSITYGFPRPPDQIRQHIFRSPLRSLTPGGPRLIDAALATTLVIDKSKSDKLGVTVTSGNTGCGHALPTGEPMRSLLLLVEASCQNKPLSPIGGMTVDDVGGVRARGVIGNDATAAGNTLVWSAGSKVAQVGSVVRVVRSSGTYHDYDGIGLFAGNQLSAKDKGRMIMDPIARASVTTVNGTTLSLDTSISVSAGDVVYLGDALALGDGQASRAYAGEAGYSFARVMVDAKGNRNVPHYRAVDLASDNRIAPTKAQQTFHQFALPPSCKAANATVSVTFLYRPVPLALAELRGWKALDYVIAKSTQSVAIP